MTRNMAADGETAQALRRAALRYPEVEEGIACKGTPLECATFKARNKAFLFVGAAEAKVKLRESQAEATKLASEQPSRYKIGPQGWATVRFSDAEPPPLELPARWIDESYRAVADKRLVAMLPERRLGLAAWPEASPRGTTALSHERAKKAK